MGEGFYAEEVNYWRTSKSSPDTWLEKCKKEIRGVGGIVHGSAIVDDEKDGRAAYAIAFELHGDKFQIKWPVLESKKGDKGAAKRQAATAMYYDVKSACVKAKFFGARTAFLAHLELGNGHTASEVTNSQLLASLPKMLVANIQQE